MRTAGHTGQVDQYRQRVQDSSSAAGVNWVQWQCIFHSNQGERVEIASSAAAS